MHNNSDDSQNESGRFRAVRRQLNPLDWAVKARATAHVVEEMKVRIAARRRRRIGGVGIGLCTLLFATWIWRTNPSTELTGDQVVPSSVVVNEPMRRALPDGSVVELRPGAVIRVAYSELLRRVVLERGEAHFQVAKNPARPFLVEARGLKVRAIGTAFAVLAREGATEVLVTEGRVAIERPKLDSPETPGSISAKPDGQRPADPVAFLDAGGHAIVDTAVERAAAVAPQLATMTEAEMSELLAWRVPTLEFSATPLSEAVPMLNRNLKRRLVLGDASVGKVRLSGVLRGDNLDTLLRLLEEDHGIVARAGANGEWVLTKTR